MEKKSHISPEMRAMLGQETILKASEPVDAGKIRRFAKSLGLEDPRYYDLEWGQPIAPLSFVFSVNHDSMVEMDERGRPTNRLPHPPPFRRGVRGGNRYQFFQPVRVGDHIIVRRKILDLQEKEGKNGPLILMNFEMEYINQHGELLGRNVETTIFRFPQDTQGGQ